MADATNSEVGIDLSKIFTLDEPLGPHESERLIGRGQHVFGELYDETSSFDRLTRKENPHFIVGRKGAGKTAFLLGAAFKQGSEVMPIVSEDVYIEVSKLNARYLAKFGVPLSDNLAHVWEVFLYHAAILMIVRSERIPTTPAREQLWVYMSSFGEPEEIKLDSLFAAVGAEMAAVLEDPQGLSFREACWSVAPEGMAFAEAVTLTREVMEMEDVGASAIYVVVDNLEELHRKLDSFADVVTALFRLVSLSQIYEDMALPFGVRFAFPAELVERLDALTAQPDKDFRNPLTIRWTAPELIVIAGNRLRHFLEAHFPEAPQAWGLPKVRQRSDRVAARRTLKAMLPEKVRNDLGFMEDTVAYLLRHTQLLPRHLILILNEVLSPAALEARANDELPIATGRQVVEGVRRAERRIVKGILAAYSSDHNKLTEAFRLLKNHIDMVESVSELHNKFGEAGVKKAGLDFDEFLTGALAVGAFGIVLDEEDRYVEAEFSYTFASELRWRESQDRICVHPLFVSRLFDQYRVKELARAEHRRAVYPYGADPEHDDHVEA